MRLVLLMAWIVAYGQVCYWIGVRIGGRGKSADQTEGERT